MRRVASKRGQAAQLAEEMLRCNLCEVLGTQAGRYVVRWILGILEPPSMAGNDVFIHGRAALHDAAVSIEERLMQLAPDEWAAALREEINERVTAARSKDNE